MPQREELLNSLGRVFPERRYSGNAAPHDCLDCSVIRDGLSSRAWTEVPREFVREHSGDLPLLSRDAYVEFLAAWLREAVLDPEGDVSPDLMANLRGSKEARAFSPEQSQVIVDIAKWIAANDGFGADDPVNVDSVAEIEVLWGKHAV